LISSGNTASPPNNNQNGVKLVARNHYVVAPHIPKHDFSPFTLLFTFEYFLDGLKNQVIGLLDCSIRPRVVYGCNGDLHPNLMVEILEHGTIKILGVVDRDMLWNSIGLDDVLPE
jgi:hypothetical protein